MLQQKKESDFLLAASETRVKRQEIFFQAIKYYAHEDNHNNNTYLSAPSFVYTSICLLKMSLLFFGRHEYLFDAGSEIESSLPLSSEGCSRGEDDAKDASKRNFILPSKLFSLIVLSLR